MNFHFAVSKLSGGQRTRLMMARLLAREPIFYYLTNQPIILIFVLSRGLKVLLKTITKQFLLFLMIDIFSIKSAMEF